MFPLLCVYDIQKMQFLTSSCAIKGLDSSDTEHNQKETEDKSISTVQVNSVNDVQLVNSQEVYYWNYILYHLYM